MKILKRVSNDVFLCLDILAFAKTQSTERVGLTLEHSTRQKIEDGSIEQLFQHSEGSIQSLYQ